MLKIPKSLKSLTIIDCVWTLFTFVGFFCLITQPGIPPDSSGRGKGGCAIFGKIEDGHYYFGTFSNYIEVSRALYIKSASYSMLAALFITLSMVLFTYTKKGKLAEKQLEKKYPLPRFHKYVPPVVIVIIGGYFFVKSLLCLLKA
jgi:hypothetical protein